MVSRHRLRRVDQKKKLREIFEVERKIGNLEDAQESLDEAGMVNEAMSVNTKLVQLQNEVDKLRKKHFGGFGGYRRAVIGTRGK